MGKSNKRCFVEHRFKNTFTLAPKQFFDRLDAG